MTGVPKHEFQSANFGQIMAAAEPMNYRASWETIKSADVFLGKRGAGQRTLRATFAICSPPLSLFFTPLSLSLHRAVIAPWLQALARSKPEKMQTSRTMRRLRARLCGINGGQCRTTRAIFTSRLNARNGPTLKSNWRFLRRDRGLGSCAKIGVKIGRLELEGPSSRIRNFFIPFFKSLLRLLFTL